MKSNFEKVTFGAICSSIGAPLIEFGCYKKNVVASPHAFILSLNIHLS